MKNKDKCLIYPLFIPHEACPGTCIYCDQGKITGAPPFDLEQAATAVSAFIKRNPSRTKEIAFYGGTFTALPAEQQEAYLARIHSLLDADSSIRISTHPLFITPEVLTLCKKYRVRTIELGIQDFCERPLRNSGRNYSPAQAWAAAQQVQASGFLLGVQLLPGLPGSDQASISQNQSILIALKPDFLRLYPLIVIRGTRLAQIYLNSEYQALSLAEAIKICADYTELCRQHDIRIIKYGLPSNLDPREVVAGPYHPAFGELVLQELLIRRVNTTPKLLAHLTPQEQQLLKAHSCQYLQQMQHKSCPPKNHNQALRN